MTDRPISIDRNLIKTLVEAWGPSGYEYEVRAIIRTLVKDLADDIRVDGLGNLICRVGSGGPKVMIAAHMDEIGLIIHHIDKDGFARFSQLGGLLPATLYSNRARFANGVIGTIGMDNPFNFTAPTPKLADMYLDLSSEEQDTSGIGVGDVACLWRNYAERGNRIIAKSMDDRIGCVVAIEAMRRLNKAKTPNELYFVFTVQEESGGTGPRGARTSAFGISPDFGIALDVTVAGDIPKSEKVAVSLGHGAAIKVKDAAHLVPVAMRELMVKRAKEANIPYQLEVLDLGSTDASQIQLSAAGVPSGAISIPCRYVHTTSETVDIRDVQSCVDLLVEVASKPFEGFHAE